MKKLRTIFTILMLATFIVACKDKTNPEVKTVEVETMAAKTTDPNATYAKAEFTIDGMTCAVGCAATIEKKIAKMEGVKSANVDFDKRLAMVEYDVAKVTPNNLIETVAKVGDSYKVSDMKTTNTSGCNKPCDKTGCEGKTDAEKAACQKACTAKNASTDTKTACCAAKA